MEALFVSYLMTRRRNDGPRVEIVNPRVPLLLVLFRLSEAEKGGMAARGAANRI